MRESIAAGVALVSEVTPHGSLFSVTNHSILLYVLNFDFSGSSNIRVVPKAADVKCRTKFSATICVKPKTKRQFVLLPPVDPSEPSDVKYTFTYTTENVKTDRERLQEEVARVAQLVGDDVEDAHQIAEMCQAAGIQFVDTTFPPDSTALQTEHPAIWRRPADITDLMPCLYGSTDVVAPDCIVPGKLGDECFLSAVGILAEVPTSLYNTLPKDDEHSTMVTAGVHYSWLVVNGWWKQIVIDSLLPCDIHTGSPLYASCKKLQQQWVTALQKAYAKCLGSYAAIVNTTVGVCLMDMTGAPFELVDLMETMVEFEVQLWKKMECWDRHNYLIAACMSGEDWGTYMEFVPPTLQKNTRKRPSYAHDSTSNSNNNEQETEHGGTPSISSHSQSGEHERTTDSLQFLSPPSQTETPPTIQTDETIDNPDTPGQHLEVKLDKIDHYAFSPVAFAVLQVVTYQNFKLLKLRSPFTKFRWTGDWSEYSGLWTDQAKMDIGYTEAEDGIFWMSFLDFQKYFNVVCASYYQPQYTDARVKGFFSKAGLPNLCMEYWANQTCSVNVIGTQNDKRLQGPNYKYNAIGLIVLKWVGTSYTCVAFTGYKQQRDVWLRVDLEATAKPYLFIPTTPSSGKTFEFVLALQTPTLKAGDLSVKACTSEVIDRSELLTCMATGKEVTISKYGSLKIVQDPHILIIVAVNRSTQMWEIKLDFRRFAKLYSPKSGTARVFTALVPGNGLHYMGSLVVNQPDGNIPDLRYDLSERILKSGAKSDAMEKWMDCQINPSLLQTLHVDVQINKIVDGGLQDDAANAEPQTDNRYIYNITNGAKARNPNTAKHETQALLPMARPATAPTTRSYDNSMAHPNSSLPSLNRSTHKVAQTNSWDSIIGKDVTASTEGDMLDLWKQLDNDSSGYISRKEFKSLFSKVECFGMAKPAKDIDQLFEKYNHADDRLTYDEFVLFMLKRAQW